MSTEDAIVCVDLGKTRCRVTVWGPDGRISGADGPGLPGLAVPGAPERTAAALSSLVAGLSPTVVPTSFGIGAAGALSAPEGAADLADRLARTFDAPVAVASDIVTAHVGAFDGAAGVCLVAGTGAVALAVAPDGRTSRRDGRGLLAGDVGSGAWIGRAGFRAAEMAAAGAAEPTTLSTLIDTGDAAVARLTAAPSDAAFLARHAPAVLSAAEAGDATAQRIVDEAVEELAATALAAALPTDQRTVSILGGLTGSDWFRHRLTAALAARDLTTRAPAGTALDGARIIATLRDLPLEGFIHRA